MLTNDFLSIIKINVVSMVPQLFAPCKVKGNIVYDFKHMQIYIL